jgi:type III restriction enzyme
MVAPVIPYDRALPEVPGRTPYTKPDAYLEKLGEGDYAVRQGRRPSDMFLVEKLRAAVDKWRDEGYDGASDVSKRLMQFWFDEDHLLKASPEHGRRDGSVFRYWWAQRESLETLIYLTEVRSFQDLEPVMAEFGEVPKHGMLEMPFQIETDMDGNRRLRRYVSEVQKDAIQDLPEKNLLRYAFKMATGSGKTVVMAIVWSYFHRKWGPGSQQADSYLIVAPNVIVFERLRRTFRSGQPLAS